MKAALQRSRLVLALSHSKSVGGRGGELVDSGLEDGADGVGHQPAMGFQVAVGEGEVGGAVVVGGGEVAPGVIVQAVDEEAVVEGVRVLIQEDEDARRGSRRRPS